MRFGLCGSRLCQLRILSGKDLNDKDSQVIRKALPTLFLTEMWERFSYYGMRALLVLYMTQSLHFADAKALSIYGYYTSTAYFMPLLGGWFADRLLGSKRAVLIGGIIIACGHFSLALTPLPFFYSGLVLVAAGTGLLKPNVSTMVADLYEDEDPRRDSGFSLFHMGINLGAFIAPLARCGRFLKDRGNLLAIIIIRRSLDVKL